jgi:hypothetical protein
MKARLLRKYIHLAPVIMLAITLLSNFINLNYVIAGNIIGYSLLSNLVMWFHFNFTGKYCFITRKISLGLIFINIIDIIGEFINYGYYTSIFNVVVCSVSLTLFTIFKLKDKIK